MTENVVNQTADALSAQANEAAVENADFDFEVAEADSSQAASDIKEICIKTNMTTTDFYQAHLTVFYRRGTVIAAFILAAIIVVDFVCRMLFFSNTTSTMFWVLVAITCLGVSLGLPMGLRAQIRKLYDRNIFYKKNLKIKANAKGITIVAQSDGKKLAWGDFSYIKQAKEYFVFQIDQYKIVCLPIATLTKNQIMALRGMILKGTANNKEVKVKLP